MSMLRVSLLGNLGADPEVRYSQKGTQIVSLRVAVNLVRKGPDGERQESTEWFRVRVTNRQSEFVQRLGKGSRVLVIGGLDIGRYTTKDGETRPTFDVWADEVQSMVSPPRGGGEPFASTGESEAEAGELALAGVSSLSGARAAAGANGGAGSGTSQGSSRGGRTTPRAEAPPAAAAAAAAAEDLDDLPF
jgi:single-strand DNA-binding protein